MMRILEPGMLTTVQDVGRIGFASMGVPPGGAADSLSLCICNRMLGNPDKAPGLEFTLTGGLIQFDQPTTLAIGGGQAEISLHGRQSRPLALWHPFEAAANEQLRIGPVTRGCRVYLAVRGGIRVPAVLGSCSTLLSAGFGGHEGRALRMGDELAIGAPPPTSLRAVPSALVFDWPHQRTFRAIELQIAHHFDAPSAARFWEAEFTISNHSDRAGLRLDGPAIPTLCHGHMTSEGMATGAIEIPGSGQPIILGVDHPTTGGYPAIACVASVDLPALGQLRPRDVIRFEKITLGAARSLREERERLLLRELPPG